jgi:hypothetical protein
MSLLRTLSLGIAGAIALAAATPVPDWIQIAEVEAFELGTLDNVASAAEGGSATATSAGFGGSPGGAIDGNASISFGPHFFHSNSSSSGEKLSITLGRTADLTQLRIFGRDGVRERDFWNVKVFNAQNVVLFEGQLDARTTQGSVAVADFAPTGGIPEPSTWAMMILGFGAAGTAIRSRRRASVAAA